jgi:hypothetical protein
MKRTTNAGVGASAAEATPATEKPVAPSPSPAPAVAGAPEAKRPARGGSYVVQPNGSLDCVEATKEPSLIERVAAAAEKGEADHG